MHHLYFWVLLGTFLGGLIGYLAPSAGEALRPLGEGFIALVKIFIGPIVFCTIVSGIARTDDMKKVGRIGGKAFLYFEIVSTFALVIGLFVVNWIRPGQGFNADIHATTSEAVAQYATKASDTTLVSILMHIIPRTFLDAFTGNGDLLQVLLIAVMCGWALHHIDADKRRVILGGVDSLSTLFAKIMNGIMYLAPIGAAGAMAFMIGKYGMASLYPLLHLIGSFYLTCVLFIGVVLGAIAAVAGFNVFKFIYYIRQEMLLVLATSSSESALVPLMEKLERAGCSKSVVGLVVPSGYSFNLDGTNIYLTMAALFIAQAYNIDLSLSQQLSLLGVAVLSSKGAAGVTGAGFITLAATLTVVPEVPVAGLALILGVDRFMSEARALTNIVGNGVATIVISRWENELDRETLQKLL